MNSLPDHRVRMCRAAITPQGYVTVFPNAQPAIDTLSDVIRCLYDDLLARGASEADIETLLMGT